MSERKLAKPVALAVGAALAGSFAMTGLANADSGASPFAMTTLSSGFLLGAGEGSCGEGKCGGDKDAEGECGEGKCGGDKDAEGSCGEGKCGGDKDAEGKCGEGKCGGAM